MTAGAERRSDLVPPPSRCAARGGCSYLRALATFERLAGFESTARSYGAEAARCREQGCWAASHDVAKAPESETVAPIPIGAVPASRRGAAPGQPSGTSELIPFVPGGASTIIRDQQGNYVERRALRLESLPGKNDPLGYLYQYWRGLRAETDCRLTDVDIVHLDRAGIIGKLHILDVSSGDPGEFRFDLFGYALPVGKYHMPRSHPVGIWVDSLLSDYDTVRVSGEPRLHRVRSRLGDVAYHYTRLILPFLDQHQRVRSLAVAIRQEVGDGVQIKSGH